MWLISTRYAIQVYGVTSQAYLPVDHLQYTINGVHSQDEVTLKDRLYYYASVLLKSQAPILSVHNWMKVLPV